MKFSAPLMPWFQMKISLKAFWLLFPLLNSITDSKTEADFVSSNISAILMLLPSSARGGMPPSLLLQSPPILQG